MRNEKIEQSFCEKLKFQFCFWYYIMLTHVYFLWLKENLERLLNIKSSYSDENLGKDVKIMIVYALVLGKLGPDVFCEISQYQ